MIARLLLFVYASTYPTTAVSHEPITQFKMLKEPFTNYGGLPQEWVFRAKIHAQMYSMADKYDMPLLKAQARQRFLISFYKRDKYDSKTSRIVAGDDNRAWANIANIISYVYTEARSPDSGLRDIVLSYYTQQMNDPNTLQDADRVSRSGDFGYQSPRLRSGCRSACRGRRDVRLLIMPREIPMVHGSVLQLRQGRQLREAALQTQGPRSHLLHLLLWSWMPRPTGDIEEHHCPLRHWTIIGSA